MGQEDQVLLSKQDEDTGGRGCLEFPDRIRSREQMWSSGPYPSFSILSPLLSLSTFFELTTSSLLSLPFLLFFFILLYCNLPFLVLTKPFSLPGQGSALILTQGEGWRQDAAASSRSPALGSLESPGGDKAWA